MMVVEIISQFLGVFYVFFFISAVFSSSRFLMRNQMNSYFGKILFIAYSFFVYIKGVSISIPFWNVLVNEPILFGFTYFDKFLNVLFGFTIKADPLKFLMVFFGASFVYNFLRYWFDYGFGDERISRLMAFAAVYLFIRQGWRTGLAWGGLTTFLAFGSILPGIGLIFGSSQFFMSFFMEGATLTSHISNKIILGVLMGIVSLIVLFILYWLLFVVLMKYYALIKRTGLKNEGSSLSDSSSNDHVIFWVIFGVMFSLAVASLISLLVGAPQASWIFLGLFVVFLASFVADLLLYVVIFMLFNNLTSAIKKGKSS